MFSVQEIFQNVYKKCINLHDSEIFRHKVLMSAGLVAEKWSRFRGK